MTRKTVAATLLYDDDCAFCRRCVAFAQARLRRPVTFIAADSPEGRRSAEVVGREADVVHTILWLHRIKVYDRSAATIRVLWAMRGPWPVAGALLWSVPKPLRDLGYRWVARRRSRWAG